MYFTCGSSRGFHRRRRSARAVLDIFLIRGDERGRIEFKNLSAEALEELRELFEDLDEDEEFRRCAPAG
jgi:hypothetical protein